MFVDNYLNSIVNMFRIYHGVWLPNTKLNIGDIGFLNRSNWYSSGNLFQKVTSLERQGISVPKTITNAIAPINCSSSSEMLMIFKLAGEVNVNLPGIPREKAGVAVSFGKQGGFIFQTPECQEICIEYMEDLENQILKADSNHKWKDEWVIVTGIVKAPIATVIISESATSSIEFIIDGNIPAVIQGSPFQVNANIEFSVRKRTGKIFDMAGIKDATPIFKLTKIRKKPQYSWPTVFIPMPASAGVYTREIAKRGGKASHVNYKLARTNQKFRSASPRIARVKGVHTGRITSGLEIVDGFNPYL